MYEYAVPCPAAFDLANHFSECGGLDCDYSMLPGRHVRRMFTEEYLRSYSKNAELNNTVELAIDDLLMDLDQYRDMPGFYRGCQALIQAQISHVEFDWVLTQRSDLPSIGHGGVEKMRRGFRRRRKFLSASSSGLSHRNIL